MKRIAILDRDGTINRKAPEGDYITRPDRLELLPTAAHGIRILQAAGFVVVIATNQRGIALGRMTVADLEQVHSRLNQLLADADAGAAPLDGLYVCPHGLGMCDCRKPLPGLLLQALAEHDGCAGESFMVGDSDSDIDAAQASGVISVRIGREPDPRAAYTAPDLAQAAGWIVSRGSGSGPDSQS